MTEYGKMGGGAAHVVAQIGAIAEVGTWVGTAGICAETCLLTACFFVPLDFILFCVPGFLFFLFRSGFFACFCFLGGIVSGV